MTKWCAQTFTLIVFVLFAIFDRNFAKIVAQHSRQNENCSNASERTVRSEKVLKTASKSTHNPSHNTYLNYTVVEKRANFGGL